MFGEGSNKLLLPTQSTCNVLCVCCMYACYKINMFKPIIGRNITVNCPGWLRLLLRGCIIPCQFGIWTWNFMAISQSKSTRWSSSCTSGRSKNVMLLNLFIAKWYSLIGSLVLFVTISLHTFPLAERMSIGNLDRKGICTAIPSCNGAITDLARNSLILEWPILAASY